MTLTQRREIMKRFMAGESTRNIETILSTWWSCHVDAEQVLRDYLLGKFSLKTRRKK